MVDVILAMHSSNQLVDAVLAKNADLAVAGMTLKASALTSRTG